MAFKAVSFSSDITDTQRIYGCDDLGFNEVEIWVTDDYDNQDYCVTFVEVQANGADCGNDPLVAGTISNEENNPVEGVTVDMSGQSNAMMMTDNTGAFNFEVPNGNDVTITPSKDDDHLNGVTTYDIVFSKPSYFRNSIIRFSLQNDCC